MLTRIGFYREFFPDRLDLPTLASQVRPQAVPDADRVVAYLRSGHVMSAVMEGMLCAVDGRPFEEGSGCSSLLTDGRWLWRWDLAHYVEAHHVERPGAFLAQAHAGQVPSLTREERDRLAEVERREYGPDWWVGPTSDDRGGAHHRGTARQGRPVIRP